MASNRHAGSLIGGALLIFFGAMALMGELFSGFRFWSWFWPFIIIGIGVMFYVGVLAGGKSTSGLAIPGTIITVMGLMLLFQRLTGYWESWTYGWTVILMSVGLGIYIMGMVNGEDSQRRAGMRVLWLGLVLFVVFGAFFEMILSSGMPYMNIFFPVALVVLGGYLIIVRSGLFSRSRTEDVDRSIPPTSGQPPTEGK